MGDDQGKKKQVKNIQVSGKKWVSQHKWGQWCSVAPFIASMCLHARGAGWWWDGMKEGAVVFLMLQASRTWRVWGCAVGCGIEEGGGKQLTYLTELLVSIVIPFPSTGVKEVGVWWMQVLGAALFIETLWHHSWHTCKQQVMRPARLQWRLLGLLVVCWLNGVGWVCCHKAEEHWAGAQAVSGYAVMVNFRLTPGHNLSQVVNYHGQPFPRIGHVSWAAISDQLQLGGWLLAKPWQHYARQCQEVVWHVSSFSHIAHEYGNWPCNDQLLYVDKCMCDGLSMQRQFTLGTLFSLQMFIMALDPRLYTPALTFSWCFSLFTVGHHLYLPLWMIVMCLSSVYSIFSLYNCIMLFQYTWGILNCHALC